MIEPLLQAERLMLHDMIDQAEQIYRRVAEQDPRNAIAVVGLARVALERGDEQAALDHSRRALEIDPQNAVAIRLAARLSEVLAERRRQQAGPPPAWASTQPPSEPPASDAPAFAASEARPSEQAVFTRNPSMADHRRLETAGEGTSDTPSAAHPSDAAEPNEGTQTARRPSLLDRLLRRRARS